MPPEEILVFFANYIEKELGIVYDEHNYFQLQNRLDEIAKLLGISSTEKLYKQAQDGITGAFKQLLLDLATNNETSFFRDMKVFKCLENKLLSHFLAKHNNLELRIWSAASSTGQEALSLAMLIEEWSEKNQIQINYSILGTDISEKALTKARSFRYTQLDIQRGLPSALLIKYFNKDDNDQWTAVSRITDKIKYRNMNLKSEFMTEQDFHVILCRNMLIYQRIQAKSEIIAKLGQSLTPEGLLVLGSGESLIGLSTSYEQVFDEGAILYKRKTDFSKAA